MGKLLTIFKIPELRRKVIITLIFLAVYRIGFYIPLPMVDQEKLAEKMANAQGGALGQVLGFVSMFSGGNLSQACIFSLGIMPYISASIIIQLLSSGVVPSLEKLRKEGESGRKKINEITRWLTVPICAIQSLLIVKQLMVPDSQGGGFGTAAPGYAEDFNLYYFGFTAVLTMTTGTIFLMWLGEQIDEYGIGNGISLIIMAGIVARIPDATVALLFDAQKPPVPVPLGSAIGVSLLLLSTLALFFWNSDEKKGNVWLLIPLAMAGAGIAFLVGRFPLGQAFQVPAFKESILTLGSETGDVSLEKLIVLMLLFVAVVVGVIAMTKAQRRIPTQSAKHVRGRRVYGGTRQYLPMKVNASGVMPVIFASTLLILPYFVCNVIANWTGAEWAATLATTFQSHQSWLYNIMYIVMIYLFCYFWVAITFNPKEIADNLKDYGSFIPGYRPGKRTADYLERVLMRITYVGAAFLAIIAIIPNIISSKMNIPPAVASFYGGTGLLIVISVALDLVQKINSHLVMRNYPGLTDE